MPLSSADIEWLLQRDGAEPGIYLATITGPEIPGAIRLARNTEDFTSRGETFTAAWFNATLPNDTTEQPRVTLELPNVDREVGLLLIEGVSGLTVTIELVRPSVPDAPVYACRMLKLRNVSIDPVTVSGELSAALYDNEPYIPLRVGPRDFPGLYRLKG